MTQRRNTPDPADYLLGLEDDPAPKADPEFDAAVADWAARLSPLDEGTEISPPPELWSRISARLDEVEETPGIQTVPPEAGVWELVAPGVERKIVYQSPERDGLSYFVRLKTGATLPKHDHPGNEHCVVLEGRLQIGKTEFGPGSYQFAAKGNAHPPVTALSPALLFIHGSV